MTTHSSILIVHFPPLCFTFFFVFCSCPGADVPEEAREIYRGTLILEQSVLSYQVFGSPCTRKGV